MGQPVTTNPLIIMLINMTVVFAVLIGLSMLIRLIHFIDPTRRMKKKKKKNSPSLFSPKRYASRKREPKPEPEPEPEPANGLSEETVAVIMAALAAYGYGESHVHSIRPIERAEWQHAARMQGMHGSF